jgi:hypothetical protein
MERGGGRYGNQGNEHVRRKCWGLDSNIPPSQRAANCPTDTAGRVVLFQNDQGVFKKKVAYETHHQVIHDFVFIEEPFLRAGRIQHGNIS